MGTRRSPVDHPYTATESHLDSFDIPIEPQVYVIGIWEFHIYAAPP